jgi:hypothetical protein
MLHHSHIRTPQHSRWRMIVLAAAVTSLTTADLSAQTTAPLPRIVQPSAASQTSARAPSATAEKAAQATQVDKQFRLAIAKCWMVDPSAVSDNATKTVQIEFVIKRSGDLAGVPRIVNQRGQPTPVALALSAVRAIQTCAPYTNLPTEAFDKGTLPVRMTFDAKGL